MFRFAPRLVEVDVGVWLALLNLLNGWAAGQTHAAFHVGARVFLVVPLRFARAVWKCWFLRFGVAVHPAYGGASQGATHSKLVSIAAAQGRAPTDRHERVQYNYTHSFAYPSCHHILRLIVEPSNGGNPLQARQHWHGY